MSEYEFVWTGRELVGRNTQLHSHIFLNHLTRTQWHPTPCEYVVSV